MKHALIAWLMTAGLAAAECPAAKDHSNALQALFDKAQNAPNESAAQPLSGQMWELWADAPDAQAQAVLDRGMSKRASYDFQGALADFDVLVAYCPDYAEGYNQRAFVNFLSGNFAVALEDLDRAIERSPQHVAALAGRALTLMELGRISEARTQLRGALQLNPWLSERHLLAKGARLAPKGQDI